MKQGVYFISGIDTDIGKTVATGILAKQLLDRGIKVITQKLVQTGNQGFSEDILKHRELMQVDEYPEDQLGLTAPQIFSYPASPHLATRLDQRDLDLLCIQNSTEELIQQFDVVLLEGAGGLMVPLTEQLLTIDYVVQQQYPVILVTSGRLGSINHTLLSLHAISAYGLKLHTLIFNAIHDAKDPVIAQDTRQYLRHYIELHHPNTQWMELPRF